MTWGGLFDMAEVYGFGKSEQILAHTLGADRNRVFVANKAFARWAPVMVRRDVSPRPDRGPR